MKQSTPGSCHLVLQCLVPCLLFQAQDTTLIVDGGTLTDMQPTIAAQRQVYKLMREMGIVIGYEVRKHGQFPSVIGTVATKVQKLTKMI